MSFLPAREELLKNGCNEAYVEELMGIFSNKPATVISTTYCTYCTKAKRVLNQSDVPYNEILLDKLKRDDQKEVANCIYGTSQPVVPIVFLHNKKIGGFSELQ